MTQGSQVLDEFIRSKQMTLKQFADLVGVAHSTVLHWRRGCIRPSAPKRMKIERATGGRVAASSWMTDEEIDSIARVDTISSDSVRKGLPAGGTHGNET